MQELPCSDNFDVCAGPVPIIADALGYHPATIERHAVGSASVYAQYVATRRETQ